jgi:hypothetical protein
MPLITTWTLVYMAKMGTTGGFCCGLFLSFGDLTITTRTNPVNFSYRKAFALAWARLQRELSHASRQCRDEKLHRQLSKLLPNVLIDSHGAVFGGRRQTYGIRTLQLDDGLRRDLPDFCAFYVDRLGPAQTHLSLVQRDL